MLAQFELAQKQRGPLLIIVNGVEGSGRHETANQLTGWMDPRHIRVVAFGKPLPEEAVRPRAWRYWHDLPARGTIGIFMGGWYHDLIADRCNDDIDDASFDDALLRVRQHEEMLVAEGVRLLKFWIHLSRPAQKARIKAIEADPDERWRITSDDKRNMRRYNRLRPVWEHVLRQTSIGVAPWFVVEGADARYRELTIGRLTLDALRGAAATVHPPVAADTAAPSPAVLGSVDVIRKLDLSRSVPKKRYEDELGKYQGRLARLTRAKRFREHALVLGFEGLDAAGKGGAIRRVTGALDARQYVTVPVAAPNDEERAHPYLWRFWVQVPRRGGITIFDRTWYGRVLVERVEGYLLLVGLDARLRRDQPVRGTALRVGNRRVQVLAADQQGRAARALPGAAEDRVQALQDHARRLAQPAPLGRLRTSVGGHGRTHVDRRRPLDAGRGQRQEPCAHQDSPHRLRPPRARA